LSEVLNHIYFVSAHIISDLPQGRWKVTEEHFTSLCYAGHLPGYTMSYNHHGFVYSVNIISAKTLVSGRTRKYRPNLHVYLLDKTLQLCVSITASLVCTGNCEGIVKTGCEYFFPSPFKFFIHSCHTMTNVFEKIVKNPGISHLPY